MEHIREMGEGSPEENLEAKAFEEVLRTKLDEFCTKHPEATPEQVQMVEQNIRRIYGLNIQKVEDQINTLYADKWAEGAVRMRSEIDRLTRAKAAPTISPEDIVKIDKEIAWLEESILKNESASEERRGMVSE